MSKYVLIAECFFFCRKCHFSLSRILHSFSHIIVAVSKINHQTLSARIIDTSDQNKVIRNQTEIINDEEYAKNVLYFPKYKKHLLNVSTSKHHSCDYAYTSDTVRKM